MNKIVNFQSEIFNLERINPLVSRYKLYIAYADEPANNYVFSKEVLDNLSSTIKGCAVVAGFMNGKDGSILGGHEMDLAIDDKHQITPTPTPIPVGFAAYDIDPWWETYNGRDYITTFIYVWDGRFPELGDLSNRKIFQSMEVAIDDSKKGIYKIVNEALALGLCLLENVDPAFSGSHIEKFSVDDLKQEYESFAHRYESLDFKIPQAVKKAAQEGLDLRKELGRGSINVGISMARYLISNEKATPEKVKKISAYFPRHAGDNLDDKTSNGWIAWQLWGGYAGRKWSTNLVKKMNELDERKLSFMSNHDDSDNNMLEAFVNKEEIEKQDNNSISQIDDPPLEEGGNKRVINKEKMSEFCDGQKYSKDEQEMCKYTYISHDDKNLFAYDNEFSKFVTIPYSVDEEDEEKFSVDMEGVKGAKMSMRMMADDEEGEDEVYMAISQMLSANQNVDAVAMQKMNEDVAEENKRLAEENNDISQKFSTLETEHNALKEETEKLRKFKSDIETQNKKFAVESTLKDVADILPEDAMKECRDSAEKFSLDDIDIWKNEVKAKAFNFSKQIPEKRDYLWMALPNAGKPKKGDGLWD